MERPVDFDVPVTFRNWNFARLAWSYLVCSVIALWVNDRSSYGLSWFGVALQLAFLLATILYAASWVKASLRAAHDVVILGGVFKTRRFIWDEVQSFSILPPAERTPFLLAFWPWRDQARLTLENGHSYRIRGLQPRHGFTVVTYFIVNRRGPADTTVDSLNAFRQRRLELAARGL